MSTEVHPVSPDFDPNESDNETGPDFVDAPPGEWEDAGVQVLITFSVEEDPEWQ